MIYFRHFDTVNWWNTIVSVVSIIISAITPKFSKKIPGSLIAIVVVHCCRLSDEKPSEESTASRRSGDRFTIKSELPDAVVPALRLGSYQRELFPVAITIAVLGAIESLLIRHGSRRCDRRPPRFQYRTYRTGAANIVAPLFGGIPATGAIARTMTNINNGGKTPIAGIIHAVVFCC